MKENRIELSALGPMPFHIHYVETDVTSPANVFDQHVHSECEIYINLTGNVSFMVEDHIYPISAGNVIITRPFEGHHCIYHGREPHKHFWILFSDGGNEHLLHRFFDRRAGENNLITLSDPDVAALVATCRRLLEPSLAPAAQYGAFFALLEIFDRGNAKMPTNTRLTPEIATALDRIHTDFATPLRMQDLAHDVGLSISTFERQFEKHIGLSPRDYLFKKRISHAAALLAQGHTVKETCDACGFPDYAHFIATFKKTFGVTPLQYRKRHE